MVTSSCKRIKCNTSNPEKLEKEAKICWEELNTQYDNSTNAWEAFLENFGQANTKTKLPRAINETNNQKESLTRSINNQKILSLTTQTSKLKQIKSNINRILHRLCKKGPDSSLQAELRKLKNNNKYITHILSCLNLAQLYASAKSESHAFCEYGWFIYLTCGLNFNGKTESTWKFSHLVS